LATMVQKLTAPGCNTKKRTYNEINIRMKMANEETETDWSFKNYCWQYAYPESTLGHIPRGTTTLPKQGSLRGY
jgi:hypothetical protein